MKGSTASILAGTLAVIGGLIALLFPFFASLAVTGLVGGAFMISGGIGLYAAASDPDLPSRGWLAVFPCCNWRLESGSLPIRWPDCCR